MAKRNARRPDVIVLFGVALVTVSAEDSSTASSSSTSTILPTTAPPSSVCSSRSRRSRSSRFSSSPASSSRVWPPPSLLPSSLLPSSRAASSTHIWSSRGVVRGRRHTGNQLHPPIGEQTGDTTDGGSHVSDSSDKDQKRLASWEGKEVHESSQGVTNDCLLPKGVGDSGEQRLDSKGVAVTLHLSTRTARLSRSSQASTATCKFPLNKSGRATSRGMSLHWNCCMESRLGCCWRRSRRISMHSAYDDRAVVCIPAGLGGAGIASLAGGYIYDCYDARTLWQVGAFGLVPLALGLIAAFACLERCV